MSVDPTAVATHLLARYCWAIDDAAYEDLANVFTADATADYGAFGCHGVASLVETMTRLHRDLRTTQHLVGTVLAEEQSGGLISSRAHVRAALVAPDRRRVEVAATYRDVIKATESGWRVADRRVQGRWACGHRAILPWFAQVAEDTRGGTREEVGFDA